jgi:hypothetical protein
VIVGQYNIENERKLVLVEQRLADVEEICEYLAKAVDGLTDFYLEVNEWR